MFPDFLRSYVFSWSYFIGSACDKEWKNFFEIFCFFAVFRKNMYFLFKFL